MAEFTMELQLNNGIHMPRLGMGAWLLGESKKTETEELEALQAGLDAGVRLIDTAEMYGNGRSEGLIGEAIKGYNRDHLFLVSKVLPQNAGKRHIFRSVEKTLKNLETDYLDLYLLHWRGSIPLEETVSCMEQLVKDGIIRSWGVSNFGSRGVEYDLLPWLTKHKIPLMAYCPLAQAGDLRGELLSDESVRKVAETHGITKMQVLLAFVLYKKNVIAIPRSGKKEHVLQNWDVRRIELTEEEYHMLDEAFPAPQRKTYLDIV